ncbi:LAGLIDADG family homing endonuclease [Ferrovum sp.]|uniref:LAGLIDADG family homing endonuclease n=1 Tax=Ferrovum sp. TaxID=2609467 RepID=UPI002631249D|nr:LAGLIDADG family homing endonuclease [Ferrovum sp.]
MTKESINKFISVFNDLINFPSILDVANELNISEKTVRNKAAIIRSRSKNGDSVLLIDRSCKVPMSENLNKITDDWTKEQCVAELLSIAKIDPDRVVTRNYFRIHGSIAESVWSRHYGTFEEFKRQAGIKLSRQQHHLERQIAKHASVDHYRRISVERLDYAEKYTREGDNRFKTILACSDLHDVDIDPFYLRVLIDTAKRVQPDVISLVGDTFDAAEFGKYTVDPRDWDIVGKIKFVHENIFKPLREACPNAQIDLIEGNHECVQEDTEILTGDGWVIASEITLDSKVASYTLDGEALTFRVPLAIKTIEDADLWSVKGDLSDELVSSTHRIDVDGKLQNVKEFSKVNQARFRYAVKSNKSEVTYDHDWLALVTWVVMDGTIVTRKHQPNYKRIQFKLSKERKLEKLRELLDRMGIGYTFRKATLSGGNKLQPYYITIYGEDGRAIAEKVGSVKRLPESFKSLSASQLSVVLESIKNTDGHDCHNHLEWITTSKHDADIIQLACVFNGIACKIKSVENGSGFKASVTKVQYRVSIFNKGVSNRRYVEVKNSNIKGTVVAIQTINGTLVTRRNGKVAFTGNCRLLRQLADATPALRAVLSDLHGFTIGKLLGLDDYQINYVAKANLAAWSKRDVDKELANNYKIYWDSVICHHFPHARNMGLPGVNGHHHRHQVWGMFNPVYGPYEWHQLGAGHVRSASYCEGEVWHNGFAIVNVDTQKHSVNFDYVPVTDFAVSGGKWYLRNSDEEVASVPKNIFV